ncbi:MAG: DUF6089 family protein [Cyclobacteriaceae bacterium]|nr:DUF6089 family protein [Cyclobacteriaceae bacterium]
MKRILVFVFTLFTFAQSVDAQTFFNSQFNRRFLVSGGSGISSYFGDLNSPRDILDPSLNIDGAILFMAHPQVGIKTEYIFFRLAGADNDKNKPVHLTRNLSFKGNNHEITVSGQYNFITNGSRFYQRQPFNAYVFTGVGVNIFTPWATLDGKLYRLRPRQTEGRRYARATPVIPVGAGIKVMINPFFNVVLEGGYRKTFTDYLDDVSTVYIDNSSFDDPISAKLADRGPEVGASLREAGSIRGNPNKKDAYFILSAKVEFYLPPEIINIEKLQNKMPRRKKPANRRRRR